MGMGYLTDLAYEWILLYTILGIVNRPFFVNQDSLMWRTFLKDFRSKYGAFLKTGNCGLQEAIRTVLIGEVAEVYFDEDCLTEGVPDVSKIDPIFFGPVKGQTQLSGCYWKMGDYLARAWNVGKELKGSKI
jgi:hypothetical protein